MSKPLRYYCDHEHLNKLCERFGSQLELLDRNQKLELRIILTYFVWGQDEMGDEYSVNDAWADSIQHLLIEDVELEECLEILQGISVRDAESLLEALQAQCRHGNARLKTAIETQTEDLKSMGVSEELAAQASNILFGIDNFRARTEQEQGIINKVHKFLMGVE